MATEAMVKRYKSGREYERDVQKMAKRGWRVVNVFQEQKRNPLGCFLLGIGYFLMQKVTLYVVTYEKI